MSAEHITPSERYYLLHREEKLAKLKEKYNNRPDIIAKRVEKDRIRKEREQAKEQLRLEKEKQRQLRIEAAKASSRSSGDE